MPTKKFKKLIRFMFVFSLLHSPFVVYFQKIFLNITLGKKKPRNYIFVYYATF